MAEQMDPEDVQGVQKAYFSVMRPAIEQHGGRVEKYIGDAVLAVFGVPHAHEDDPERAVRAALTMQDTIPTLNDELRLSKTKQDNATLSLRIGIHTGLVVSTEDTDGDFVVTGDTVNFASRLESSAEPGTVLVSEEAHKLVTHAFVSEKVEPIQAKGKSEAVTAFRIISPRPTPAKLRGIPGLDSPLVGRENEFAALQKALDQLQRGVGGIVTVVGEAGIGKSRLLAEARKANQTANQHTTINANWIEGRCLSYGVTIPYLLWIDVLRSALDVTLDDSTEVVAERLRAWVEHTCPDHFTEVYPYLARLLSLPLEAEILIDLSELDPRNLKKRTFQAMERALTRAASSQPLALVCEDLHWADTASVELLEHCLPLVNRTSLLLILISRPNTDHDSWRLRDVVMKEFRHRHSDLWLQSLSATDSETLVANLLHFDTLPQALRWRILSRAEGNPFFVEEVIRTLIDMQAITFVENSNSWQATKNLSEVPIPDTLLGVITARIDCLQTDTRHILQLASVIGRIFLYQVLAALAEEERGLDGKLVTLQREELIRERARIPELEYIFKHELTREAAYNSILKRERKQFHRQVAEALEKLYPDRLDEMLPLLAYHWQRAENPEMAATYLIKAGDYARLAYGLDDAFDFYDQAIALLRQLEDDHRLARTLMKLGQTYHDALDLDRSQQAYDQAFEIWNRLDRSHLPQSPHTWRVVCTEPATFDPAMSPDGEGIPLLYSGLVMVDVDGDAIPDTAQSWKIRDDGRTYIFKIRPDARWSDGTPVTAYDFEFAWRRVLDPDLNSPHAALFFDVIRGAREYHRGQDVEIGVRVEDDLTLVVELEGPVAYFLRLLGSMAGYPIPRHIVDKYGAAWAELRHYACNGPFVITSYEPGVSMVWERNPYHTGPFRGNVGHAEDIFNAMEWSEKKRLYAQDVTDWLEIDSWQHASETRKKFSQDYYTFPLPVTYFLTFDLTREPFDNICVRRAFVQSINRAKLPYVIEEFHDLALGGLIPHTIPGHQPDIGLHFDPDLARELMAQSGHPQDTHFPPISFLHFPGMAAVDTLVESWQQILGVVIDTIEIPIREYIEERAKWHEVSDIRMGLWHADVRDPDNFLRAALDFHGIRWQHPSYRRLMESALHLSDQNARLEMYREADKMLIEEAVVAPLWYCRLHGLRKPWIKAFSTDTIFAFDARAIIIEPH